jgi:hypothetical protein
MLGKIIDFLFEFEFLFTRTNAYKSTTIDAYRLLPSSM